MVSPFVLNPRVVLLARVAISMTPAEKGVCARLALGVLLRLRPGGGLGFGSTSYADVAAFEVDIHWSAPLGGRSLGSLKHSVATLVSVAEPIRVLLDSNTVDEIFQTVEVFSSHAAIFRFRGFCPSLSNLHAWISKFWEPIISN